MSGSSAAVANIKEYRKAKRERDKHQPYTAEYSKLNYKLLRLGLRGDQYDEELARVRELRPLNNPVIPGPTLEQLHRQPAQGAGSKGLQHERSDLMEMIAWGKQRTRSHSWPS